MQQQQAEQYQPVDINSFVNSVDDEHTQSTLPATKSVPYTIIVSAALKEAGQGWYVGAICKVLKVKKRTVHLWFKQGWFPRNREIELLVYIDKMIEKLTEAKSALVTGAKEREKQPKKRHGMLVIKDHGDGLPPHNQQVQTLKRLGLEPAPKLGKTVSTKS